MQRFLVVWATTLAAAHAAAAQEADAPPGSPQPVPPAELRVLVDGELHGQAQLEALRAENRAAAEELERDPPADEAARADLRAAIEQELAALDELLALMGRVARAPSLREAWRADVEQAREELARLRVESEPPPDLGPVDQARVEAEVAEASRRTQRAAQARAELESREDAVERRQALFETIGADVERAGRDLALLRERLETMPAEAEGRAALRRQARAAELRLRRLELARDAHVPLLELDRLERDRAQALLDLARERSRIADEHVAAVREAHQRLLEQEAERARRQAAAQRRQAELEELPSLEALGNMGALAEQLDAEAAQARASLRGLERAADEGRTLLAQVRARTERLRRLFPTDEPLDDWKLEHLGEEQRRLQRRRTTIERWRSVAVTGVPALLADALTRRDRLETLHDHLVLRDDPELGGLDPTMLEDVAARWVAANLAFDAHSDELPPDERAAAQTERFAIAQRVEATVGEILGVIEATEATANGILRADADVRAALAARERLLDEISFWQKDPLPWSPRERAATRAEIERLLEAAGDPGASLERIARRPGGPGRVLVLAGLWIAATLLVTGRRARRASAATLEGLRPRSMDALTRTSWVLSFVHLATARRLWLAVGAGLLCVFVLPREPLAWTLFTVLAIVWGWSAARHLLTALLREGADGARMLACPDERTARGVRRLGLLLLRGLVVLVPSFVLLTGLGMPRLATLVQVTAGGWVLVLAVVGIRYRRVVLQPLPEGEGSVLGRTLHTLVVVAGPVVVLFFLGTYALWMLGYRTAAWTLASRSLAALAVVCGTVLVYQLLRALLARRVDEADHEEEPEPLTEALLDRGRVARYELVRRFLTLLLQLAAAAFLVVGLSAILGFDLQDWKAFGAVPLTEGTPQAPGVELWDVGQAFVIFLVGLAVASYLRDLLRLTLRHRMHRGSRYVIRTLTFYTVAAFGTVLALGRLGLDLEQLGWFLTAAGVGIGFGLQEVISNFVAGLILFFERPVQVGDVISVGDIEGDVLGITIRSTVVRTRDGIAIIIPNKRLITDDVINWSHGDPRTRLRVAVSVAYGSDVPLVKRILSDVAEREGRVLNRPRPEVEFVGFGESELQFSLLAWVSSPDISLRRRVRSDLYSAIDAAFRRAQITIPFPQRDLHVRSMPARPSPDATDGRPAPEPEAPRTGRAAEA